MTEMTAGAVALPRVRVATLFLILMFFGFWSALNYGFSVYLARQYGFGLEPNLAAIIEGSIILIAVTATVPPRIARPSDFFVLVYIGSVIVPMLTLYAYSGSERLPLYMAVMSLGVILLVRSLKLQRLRALQAVFPFATTLALAGAAITSVWFVVSGGLAFFNLKPLDVYEYRDAASAVIDRSGMAYLNNWSYKVFGPILVATVLLKRRYWLLIPLFALHVFWYGVSSHKSIALFPALVFAVWLFAKVLRNNTALAVGAAALGVVACIGAAALFGFPWGTQLLLRRGFFVLAENINSYFDFFGQNPHVYWSNSFLRSFVDYPYEQIPQALIGSEYGAGTHVNVSFLANGYMHAGVLGVFLYSVVLGIGFVVADALRHDALPTWFISAILIVPVWMTLSSADLPTAALTHGGIVAFVMVYLARSDTYLRKARRRVVW